MSGSGTGFNVFPCSAADIYTSLKNWSKHNSVLPFLIRSLFIAGLVLELNRL